MSRVRSRSCPDENDVEKDDIEVNFLDDSFIDYSVIDKLALRNKIKNIKPILSKILSSNLINKIKSIIFKIMTSKNYTNIMSSIFLEKIRKKENEENKLMMVLATKLNLLAKHGGDRYPFLTVNHKELDSLMISIENLKAQICKELDREDLPFEFIKMGDIHRIPYDRWFINLMEKVSEKDNVDPVYLTPDLVDEPQSLIEKILPFIATNKIQDTLELKRDKYKKILMSYRDMDYICFYLENGNRHLRGLLGSLVCNNFSEEITSANKNRTQLHQVTKLNNKSKDFNKSLTLQLYNLLALAYDINSQLLFVYNKLFGDNPIIENKDCLPPISNNIPIISPRISMISPRYQTRWSPRNFKFTESPRSSRIEGKNIENTKGCVRETENNQPNGDIKIGESNDSLIACLSIIENISMRLYNVYDKRGQLDKQDIYLNTIIDNINLLCNYMGGDIYNQDCIEHLMNIKLLGQTMADHLQNAIK